MGIAHDAWAVVLHLLSPIVNQKTHCKLVVIYISFLLCGNLTMGSAVLSQQHVGMLISPVQ